jgi:hypothetical protein
MKQEIYDMLEHGDDMIDELVKSYLLWCEVYCRMVYWEDWIVLLF